MWTWLLQFCKVVGLKKPQESGRSLEESVAERRRLQELLGCYREFGFEALVPHCKERIHHLDRRIRSLQPLKGLDSLNDA